MSTSGIIVCWGRALLNKTVACTSAEAASAQEMAKDIVAKHGLDPAGFECPVPVTLSMAYAVGETRSFRPFGKPSHVPKSGHRR